MHKQFYLCLFTALFTGIILGSSPLMASEEHLLEDTPLPELELPVDLQKKTTEHVPIAISKSTCEAPEESETTKNCDMVLFYDEQTQHLTLRLFKKASPVDSPNSDSEDTLNEFLSDSASHTLHKQSYYVPDYIEDDDQEDFSTFNIRHSAIKQIDSKSSDAYNIKVKLESKSNKKILEIQVPIELFG